MSNLPEPSGPSGDPELRAADADRERVAEVLREAAGDGRLTMEELDERLDRAFAARTYAELATITQDLPPASRPAGAPAPTRNRTGGRPTSRFAIAIMSGFSRAGHWVVGRNFSVFALMGGGQIDLRDASYAEGQVTIRAFALMGGVEIVVPEGVELHIHGIPVMGGIDQPRFRAAQPGAPRVYVFGIAVMGGITVKYKASRGDSAKKIKNKKPGDDSGRQLAAE
jgi:hypothetical protein